MSESLSGRVYLEVDPELRTFLERHVDSFAKVELLNFFHDHPHSADTAEAISLGDGTRPLERPASRSWTILAAADLSSAPQMGEVNGSMRWNSSLRGSRGSRLWHRLPWTGQPCRTNRVSLAFPPDLPSALSADPHRVSPDVIGGTIRPRHAEPSLSDTWPPGACGLPFRASIAGGFPGGGALSGPPKVRPFSCSPRTPLGT